MKLLHLHAGSGFGGVENVLITLARERGQCPQLEHAFAVCFEGRLAEELRCFTPCVTNIGAVRLSRPWTVWRARQQLRGLLEQTTPDVVACHMEKPVCLFGSSVRQLGIPFVYYNHKPLDAKTGDIYDILVRMVPRPNLVISVSHHSAGLVKDTLFDDVPIEVVWNPLPLRGQFEITLEQRTELRKALNTPSDAVVIVQATRMDAPWKGHADLLRALGRLKQQPGWRHWLIGGGASDKDEAYVTSLRNLAVELGISDRVEFVGYRRDVPACLAAADIYCQANTLSEGFGISFLEAMASGIPIVTTDIGSARETIDNAGILTPAHDVEALAEALGNIIADPDRRRALGRLGRTRVETEFGASLQLQRLHELLSRRFGVS